MAQFRFSSVVIDRRCDSGDGSHRPCAARNALFPQGYVKPPARPDLGFSGANPARVTRVVTAKVGSVFLMHSRQSSNRILKMSLMTLHYALSLAKLWCR
jgi:hypothetical protein